MNHAGRRKAIAIGNSPSTCSMIVCCVSKLASRACAPIVDRYTTLPGSALSSAVFSEVAVDRASEKPGAGSKFGGTSTKTPSAPLNAEASDVASAISAVTTSQPRSAQTFPLPMSRTTARTDRPAARRLCATLPPTLPVIPLIAYILLSLCDHHGIVTFSQRVNVPDGPSGPSSATRTTSREPSSTDCVPAYPLRFVLVKPGETRLTLMPVDSSSTIIASVIAFRAALDAG